MIKIDKDDFECSGTISELAGDAAKILEQVFIIAAEQLGAREAYHYVLVQLPELVRDVVRGKTNGKNT